MKKSSFVFALLILSLGACTFKDKSLVVTITSPTEMELIADAPSYSIQLDGKVVGFDSELDPEQADALAEQIQGLIEQIARFEEKNTLTCNQVQTSPTTVSGSIRTVRRDTWYAPNVKFKEIVMDEAPRFQLEKNWKNKCVRNRR